MNRIVKSFFQGLVILVPAVATVYASYLIFVKIDGFLRIPVPGVGFLVTLVLITLIGYLASNFFTKKLFDYFERIFTALPLIRLLYTSIKDLTGAFVGDEKIFDRPVVVTLSPEGNVKAIGFVTRESLEFLGLTGHTAVYLPQSYNFAGNLLVLPTAQIKPLETESADVMTFVVSGGVSGSRAVR